MRRQKDRKWDTIEQAVIVEYIKNPKFRKALEKAKVPDQIKAAIQKHIGNLFPSSVDIYVHFDNEKTRHLIIPHIPGLTDDGEIDSAIEGLGGPGHVPTGATACTVC